MSGGGHGMPWRAWGAGILVGVLVLVGGSTISATTASKLIQACVNRSNGGLRIVATSKSCRHSEVLLSWNQQGPAGPAGKPGPAGPQGKTGPAGRRGLPGAAGAQGATGPAGSQGEIGPAGPQGEIGPAGPQGEIGPQGLTGPQGEIGSQGLTGPEGPAGAQGEKGDVGPQGEPGPAGPQGEQGPQGIQGEKGDPGAVGPAGPTGPAGPQGPAGTGGAALSFYTRQSQTSSVPRNMTDYERSISCLTGDVVVGGGFSTNNNVEVYRSAPNTTNGWSVLFKNPTDTPYGASVYVTCADLTP